uniref:hypothetical protein n=1 Tax=Ezakiella massiliensis TaxID=1852374 RepID=UPI00094EEADA|nr:hypothetical protein [Ezakiella massiliensis]
MNNNKKSEKLSEENKSRSLFSFIFGNQEKNRERIINKNFFENKYINIQYIVSLCIAVLSSIILGCFFNEKIKTECGMSFLLFLLFGSVLVIIVVFFLSKLKEIFNSVCKFIFYGASVFFVVNLCFFALLLVITKNVIISYYLMIFLMVVLWSYISTLDNLEVAKMGNGIISAFVTLGLEFTGNLRGTLVFNDPDIMNAIVISKNVWKILLFPFVAATLIGLISCEYKEYWIKRNGKSKEIYTRYE